MLTFPNIHLRHQEKKIFSEEQIEDVETPKQPSIYSSVSNIVLSPSLPKAQLLNKISIQFWMVYAWRFDFAYSILGCDFDAKKWEALQLLVKNCGKVFFLENFCLVCDRPIAMLFKNPLVLHAEGTPAVLFSDGYEIYAYNGVELPSKYGKVPPQQWDCQWLLDPMDATVRELLIQEIGFSRIYRELPHTIVDDKEEIKLLKIKISDFEDICLLKKTCKKSEKVIFLRLPPEIKSITEGRKWLQNISLMDKS